MLKKSVIFFIPFLFLFSLYGAEAGTVGFVNVKSCLEKSKLGIQEKNTFESLKKQLSERLEKSDKELVDLAKKLEDQDYMDSLSPSAEKDLKTRCQSLNQELMRAQNQSYQMLNQANMKMLQVICDAVSSASEVVRTKHNFQAIMNREIAFSILQNLDITEEVIDQMDRQFDKKPDEKK